MSWRRIAIAAGSFLFIGVIGAMAAVSVNLMRYERAALCGSDSSRDCVHVSMGTITSPGRHVDNSWCGTGPAGVCIDRTDHSIVVTPEGSTHEVELWDTQEHADFVLGDTVKLERWHGQYIAVTDGHHRVEVNDWNPRLLEKLLVLVSVSAIVITLLWRLGTMSLNENARGFKARIKSTLGLLTFIYGSVLLLILFYVAVPASSPLTYLR